MVVDAFIAGTLIAKLAGADWGTAAGIGQTAFATVLVGILLLAPAR